MTMAAKMQNPRADGQCFNCKILFCGEQDLPKPHPCGHVFCLSCLSMKDGGCCVISRTASSNSSASNSFALECDDSDHEDLGYSRGSAEPPFIDDIAVLVEEDLSAWDILPPHRPRCVSAAAAAAIPGGAVPTAPLLNGGISTGDRVDDGDYERSNSADETFRKIRDDEETLQDTKHFVAEERKRLSKLVDACDQLKTETVRKMSTLPFHEIDELSALLSRFKDEYNGALLPSTAATANGHVLQSTDVQVKIDSLHLSVVSLNEEFKLKHEILSSIQDSIITVSFRRAAQDLIDSTFHKDEILINFSREEKFPAGLFVTCSTLEEIFKENMLHSRLAPLPIVPAAAAGQLLGGQALFAPAEEGRSRTVHIVPMTKNQFNGASVQQSSLMINSSSSVVAISPPCSWSTVSKLICCPLTGAAAGPVMRRLPLDPSCCPPTGAAAGPVMRRLPTPLQRTVAETNSPHCYFDIRICGGCVVRVVIRVRPDKAPFMAQNFIQLCLGKKGYGYRGCRVFRVKPSDHVLCGDFEHQNGSGGYSAFAGSKLFLAEQCRLKDKKGAVRMRGMERVENGRCKVGSQFMIWVGDLEYKEYKYTLVFGEVVEGLKHLQEMSRVGMKLRSDESWVLKEEVIILKCGVL